MRTAPWILLALAIVSCSGDEPDRVEPTSAPLAARTASATKRFVRLDSGETGLAFANRLDRRHVVPYLYNGAGIAVGDYDADGLPDLYLVSQDGANKLFRQTSPLRFEDVTASAGGLDGGDAWGSMATFVDIDDDGDLDLYVCNLEAPNLLYQNRGDGTFVEAAGKFGLGFVAASTTAAFADYDNDGDLDLYLLTNRLLGPTLPEQLIADIAPPADTRLSVDGFVEKDATCNVGFGPFRFPGGQPDRLLRNDGYARWTDVTEQAGITDSGMGLSATWWDYDDDGHLDLYVANDLESPDALYHNRGDGTFEDVAEQALPHTAYYGMGSDFGDVDGDGRFDFCVADMSSRTHYMSKMLMGNMGDRRWFLENARPPQYMRNALYLNTGTDRFAEAAFLTGVASTDWTWTIRFEDLDNDGLVDLFATNGIPRFDNDPDAGPEFRRLWQLGERKRALDFARNLPPVHEANLAFRNLGGLEFAEVGAEWGLDERGVSHGAIVTDLDRDGDLDIVINNLNAEASVYENRSTDGHAILVELRGRADNHFGVGARVEVRAGGRTMVRQVTLARGYLSSQEPVVHVGLGDATSVDSLRVTWPNGYVQERTRVAVDQRLVLVQPDDENGPKREPKHPPSTWFADVPTEVEHTETPFDDYAEQPLLPQRHSQMGPGLAFGRDHGLLTGAAGQASQRVEVTDGTIAFTGSLADTYDDEHLGALWFEANGDGEPDLYLVAGGVEHAERSDRLRDTLRLGGSESLTVAELADDPKTSGSCVAAADFDRDGDLDLFVGGRIVPGRYPLAPESRLLRNDEGVFRDVTATLAPALQDAGLVTSAIWSDADDDGFVDLLVTAHWQPVRVLMNREGKRLVDRTAAAGLLEQRGLWNGITAGDFDGDGDLDYAVTNLGWNSKYKAKPGHPVEIFAADFDDDGTLDIVEAKHEGERHLPVRGRSCSSAAMPFVAEKFRTFDAFARASLDEIYTESALDRATRVTATTLANAVLVNRGDARFEFTPLPRLAQIAPGFGIVAEDFDADGHLDLAIAQNSFAPEPETGRMDGGLSVVLRGRGDGTFAPVPPHRSGIVIRGDAQSLAVVDLGRDARPDMVFGRNDAPAMAFRNQSSGRAIAIRLDGGQGNPTAIGARLRLSNGDSSQVREIHAGGSYLSQSEPTAFFSLPSGDELELRVRWPDGSESTHTIDPAASMHEIGR